MTWRAVVLGAVAAGALCSLTFLNNYVLKQTTLIGNSLPASIFGGLIVAAALNLLIHRFGKRWAFTGAELAVIMAMSLTACTVPAYGFLGRFASIVLMPHQYTKTRPGWQRPALVGERLPPAMLAQAHRTVHAGVAAAVTSGAVQLGAGSPSISTAQQMLLLTDSAGIRQLRQITAHNLQTGVLTLDRPLSRFAPGDVRYTILEDDQDRVVTAFVQGAPLEHGSASVPWDAWWRTIAFWLIVVGAVWVGIIALSIVVQRRWSEQELLPYPIASFANSLLPDEAGGSGAILQSTMFRVTTSAVLAIYMLNYLDAWFPGNLPTIPVFFDLSALTEHFYLLRPAWWLGRRASIFFAVIGVAYLLASDVSFSAGISPLLYVILSQVLLLSGVSMSSGDGPMMQPQMFLSFGAYVAAALMIVYTGRSYYLDVLKQSAGLAATPKGRRAEVWGLRTFFIASLAFGLVLMWVGLPLWLGLTYFFLLSLMFLVMGRIIAETGLFFILPVWLPSGILMGLVGTHAIDGTSALILFFLCAVLAVEPKEAIAPFVINALRLGQFQKVKLGRLGIVCAAALVVGLAVGLPVFMHGQYKHGGAVMGRYANYTMPTHPFIQANALGMKMQVFGTWDELGRHTEGTAFGVSPMRKSFVVAMMCGVVLYLGCALARLRWSGWPLHPVAFLIWMPWTTGLFACSFLIGWLLKTGVMRYGGSRVYTALKPLALGLIAGELLGALIPLVVSLAYYLCTGGTPPPFKVYP
jgi:hypothetical protein